jgi:hypothetical protein
MSRCDPTTPGGMAVHKDCATRIQALQEHRRRLRHQQLLARNAWDSQRSTKQFFRRICTKFGDNTIPTLKATSELPIRSHRDKANILADNWEPVFNKVAGRRDQIDAYVDELADDWPAIDTNCVDQLITETEVRAAIHSCKSDKAVRPDGLGNGWYKDHENELTPLLVHMFNYMLSHGKTPQARWRPPFQHQERRGWKRPTQLPTDCLVEH